jgi:lipid A 3-O-deacylase
MSQAALFVPKTINALAFTLVLTFGLTTSSSTYAINATGVEFGLGVEDVESVRVNLRWNWNKYWSLTEKWHASGFWEANIGHIWSKGVGKKNIWDVGFIPTFRLRSGVSRFYFEVGVGAHMLSHDRINDSRELGSKFQFGDRIGFGWSFGEKDQREFGYRFLHFSNAHLAEPNDGVNLHLLHLGFNY